MRRLRTELDIARDELVRAVILPKPEVVDGHTRACWCSFCGARWGADPQVEFMIVGSVARRTFICSECIEGRCTDIIAEARPRKAAASQA